MRNSAIVRLFLLFWVASSYAIPLSRNPESSGESCLEAPFLYVTLHHETSNVLKYSRDGCLLSKQVLGAVPNELEMNFRGILLGQKGELYVANAAPKVGGILVYDRCLPGHFNHSLLDSGERSFKGLVTSVKFNAGANHAYGIALDHDGNIYASFQHTDTVLRFFAGTYEAMPLPPVLAQAAHATEYYYPGTFHQYGAPHVHDSQKQGVRGIAIVNDTLWVANRNLAGVQVLDLATGAAIATIPIRQPIGLLHSPRRGLVFISSKGGRGNGYRGVVRAVSAATLRSVKEMRSTHMRHPTGMAEHGSVLYVAEQALGHVFAFDIETGEELGKAVRDVPGRIEQIALSDC